MKYQINPCLIEQHTTLIQLIENIDECFERSDVVLQNARNKIKVVRFQERDYVVKSFRRPNFFNRILYTFLRVSKARRSYEYSLKIANFVPQGIGYIEHFKQSLLTSSYFISELFVYDFTIRSVLTDANYPDRERVLTAFAHFSYQLHQQGILHKDYSPGNILIQKDGNNYLFKIIDINRMEFKTLTLQERMRNFSKLWASDQDMELIANQYAELVQESSVKCCELGAMYNRRNKKIKNFKKRLKGRPVND